MMQKDELQVARLNQILGLTDSIINRKYLSFLADGGYELREATMNDNAVNIEKHARIFHLRKFVYDSNENFLNKLITVVNVAYALKGTIVTSIQSTGACIDFYIGIVAKENKGRAGKDDRQALLNAFEGTMTGNFIGSDIGNHITGEELTKFRASLDGKAICSVSVVPSLRNMDKAGIDAYVQGIENLVDAQRGQQYTLLTIADPVSTSDIMENRHGYEKLYNYLAPLYKIVETKGTSESVQLSQTDTDNYVKGITEGIARTQSRTDSTSYSNGFQLGVSFIVSAGFQHSKMNGTSVTDGMTTSKSSMEQFGTARARTTGVGHTTNDSTQVFLENRIIKSMLDKIEQNIRRIDECEGYGAFQTATYVIAQEKATALNVAGNFASLMKGERSSSQVSGINCWERDMKDREKEKTFSRLLNYLEHFAHPAFRLKENKEIRVSTSVMVSGPELTVQLGFPKKSVNGLAVLPMYPFGRNVYTHGEKALQLGQLFFMGQAESQKVELDIDSLAAHTLITGSTGTGKSNVIYGMLHELAERQVHFMVVEPAKGEYKNVFGVREDVRVFGTNQKKTDLLKINPFSFPEDVHVLEHIDRLTEIFQVCWSMYAAMPAVLKEAMEEAYLSCGWELDTSENRYDDAVFPTFGDLQIALQRVIDRSAYDEEVKSNYKGALLTRVRSLANGLNGRIFCADECTQEELFDNNVIIDLSRVGSLETKSLFMGVLVMKLQEYRMSQGYRNAGLRHVTVLEEAHHLLKRTSEEQTLEGSNMMGKSVEMIGNAIAEMRTYGEGFLIADQAPDLLDRSVIRNTNTKIILRTPEYQDRLLVGRAAGLDEGQIAEVAKLPLGVAAVYQNQWLEPVLCRFTKYPCDSSYLYRKMSVEESSEMGHARGELVKWMLMSRISEHLEPDFELIERHVEQIQMPTWIRLQVRQLLKQNDGERLQAWSGYRFDTLAGMIVDILGCEKKLRYALQHTNGAEDLQNAMENLQSEELTQTLPESIKREVNHCFMRVYAKDGEAELKKYYEWDFQIRNKLM